MWNTNITRQLGIKLPFVGAGMAIVGTPELTAAVSNAGGIGLFCLGPGTPEMLADGIDHIRRLSSAPFGVDFIVEETAFGPATTDAHVEVAVAKRVPLAVFFWNPPEERWISKLKHAGIKVWGTASSVESARRVKVLGADAVIVQSQEAGGHVKSGLGAMALVPAIVDAMDRTPVIAAGGVADGRTAAAAFMLGAQAVCVGTRLVASTESAASAEYKQRLVRARGEDTTVTTIFGPEWPDAPMRVLKNRAVARAEQGAAPLKQPIGETVVFGQPYQMPANSAVLPTAQTQGDHEEMCLAAGAGVGAVRAIESAEQIVQTVMEGARVTIRGMQDLVR
jgi:NAD(P)H-dependent flavin oxidoreductase YrpB (nitropropane dioxygenase family)